ncbi:MAG: FkbM family methyltransferase [Elusimicrobiota bacterium]|jgi:FkbM family methyltransferase
MEILTRDLTYRNPYAIEYLPALARLHLAAWSPSQRMRQEIIKLPLRPIFKWVYKTGWGGSGRMRLNLQGTWTTLPFDARNLQFTSLYMPQHAQGYEPETAALIDTLAASRSVFYDVGSNWGYYSLWIAGRAGFEGHVHAFEPLPGSFQDLTDLVARAGLAARITCHHAALSDSAAPAAMVIPDGLHSGLATVSQGPGGVAITRQRLDDLGIAAPDVIKMDVEDHEARVLAGGRQTLDKAKPHIVFESVRGRQKPSERIAPFALLEKLGYLFFCPTWVEKADGYNGYIECSKYRQGQPATLALVPFQPCQIFFLKEHLNVLACHQDKLPQLLALFSPARGAVCPANG